MALSARAKLVLGESALVNGATGSAGTIAVQIAKYLGAAKVIATGRNREALHRLQSMGADAVIALDRDGNASAEALRMQFRERIDIVLDYLWGNSAQQILAAASAGKPTIPVRFIQIGTSGGPAITLPGIVLRSSAIQLMGSGIGSVALEEIIGILARLMQAVPMVGFKMATSPLPLRRIEEA